MKAIRLKAFGDGCPRQGYRVIEDYPVVLGGHPDSLVNIAFVIRADQTLYDLASVPRFLYWLIAPSDLGLIAPTVHDYLINQQGRVADLDGNPVQINRATADLLFAIAMAADGIPQWRAVLAYLGVRVWAIVLRKEFADV